jgi:hypothetical protein
VTFGFFSVAGGCSSIGDFPSWAMTFIVIVEIEMSSSKTTTSDFIDSSLCLLAGLPAWMCQQPDRQGGPLTQLALPDGRLLTQLVMRSSSKTSELLVNHAPFNRGADRPIRTAHIVRL